MFIHVRGDDVMCEGQPALAVSCLHACRTTLSKSSSGIAVALVVVLLLVVLVVVIRSQ